MKNYLLNTIKLIILTIIVAGAIILPTVIIPVSPEIQSRISEDMQSKLFILMLLVSFIGAITLALIVKFSKWQGFRLFIGMCISFFGIEYFMAQIETLYFKEAFSFMPVTEIMNILIRGLLTTLILVSASIILFGSNKEKARLKTKSIFKGINLVTWAKKAILFAFIYIILYLFFGYFIAWQFDEVRIFYTGIRENTSFINQILDNIRNMNWFLPYHFLRGLLWVVFSVPIILMMNGSKKKTIISLFLLFAYHGFQIIMAQGFFPPEVLVAHTIETTISASLYGLIIGFLFYIPNKKQKTINLK